MLRKKNIQLSLLLLGLISSALVDNFENAIHIHALLATVLPAYMNLGLK